MPTNQGAIPANTSMNTAAQFPVVTFVDGETPSSGTSGLNTLLTLSHTPIAGSTHLFIAGLRIAPASYSLTGAVITILTSLVTGAVLVDYRY